VSGSPLFVIWPKAPLSSVFITKAAASYIPKMRMRNDLPGESGTVVGAALKFRGLKRNDILGQNR